MPTINNENSKQVYGGDMMIFINVSGSTYPVAFSTSAQLTVTLGTIDTSSKDSGDWPNKKGGRFDWNASSDAIYCETLISGSTRNTFGELFAMMLAKEPVLFVFGLTSGTMPNFSVDSSEDYFSGEVLITSLALTAPDNDKATYTISLEGASELTRT